MRQATAPREKAERCFALARSTTFAGERDAAVSRGIAIAEAAGLDLDAFDVPGRVRRQHRFDRDAFDRWRRSPDAARRRAEHEAIMRAFNEPDAERVRQATRFAEELAALQAALARRAAEVGARPGETIDEARTRNFHAAAAAAASRDRAAGRP